MRMMFIMLNNTLNY